MTSGVGGVAGRCIPPGKHSRATPQEMGNHFRVVEPIGEPFDAGLPLVGQHLRRQASAAAFSPGFSFVVRGICRRSGRPSAHRLKVC
jgi:hypothetical protein